MTEPEQEFFVVMSFDLDDKWLKDLHMDHHDHDWIRVAAKDKEEAKEKAVKEHIFGPLQNVVIHSVRRVPVYKKRPYRPRPVILKYVKNSFRDVVHKGFDTVDEALGHAGRLKEQGFDKLAIYTLQNIL